MTKKKTRAEYEFDRTEILRYLNEAQFQPVTPKVIAVYLDESFHCVSPESLDYSLRYMAERGWVEIGEEKVVGGPPRIVWAKITPDGVDELDKRIARLGAA